jgi:hypothetical protein
MREARRANLASARPLYLIALAALFAALVRAVRRVHYPWELACLGAATVPLATELSCYYSSVLVVVVLLVRERLRVGLALLWLCGVLLVLQLGLAGDVLYVCSSVALVAAAAWIVWDIGNGNVTERQLTPLPEGNGRASTSRHAWVVGAIAVCVAIVASTRWPDSLMTKDRTCEDRWIDLVVALRARANLAPPSLETRRKATTIHLVGDDFADPAKIAAFERAQGELREAIGGADDPRVESRVEQARDAYDDAVTDFDRALGEAPGAINRATGRPLLPRVSVARAAL